MSGSRPARLPLVALVAAVAFGAGASLHALAERRLMRGKMNGYGKTWHFWSVGVFEQVDEPLPLGEPRLARSFDRDGEARPGMIAARDQALGLSTRETREGRQELVPLARPQAGVDALAAAFPEAGAPPPGVRSKQEKKGASP